MYIKLDNKFEDKYPMWVQVSDLMKLNEPTFENYVDFEASMKRDIIAYCHVANDTYGIKFKLIGCWINGPNSISIDHIKKVN
jgi:hypothetical protein